MLITTRLSFLQQIQKAAISGYWHYTTGTVDIEKLPNLLSNFQKKYHINQTRQVAYRERQKGHASAKFFCYADETRPDLPKVFWVLLLTEGSHLAKQEETLKDLRLKKERFEYSDYQLVQKPNNNGKQRYTFRLLPNSFEFYADRIRKITRNRNLSQLNHTILQLNLMPGFSGVREQKKKLNSILRGQVKKYLKPEQQTKVLEMTNFYHRQQKCNSVKNLKYFISRVLENDRSIKQQLKIYRNNQKKRGKPSTKKTKKKKIFGLLNFKLD